MPKGNHLWRLRSEILIRLYDEGAFWSRSSVEMVWLKYTLAVDVPMTEYKPFIDWLKEEGLIEEGPKGKLYLTSEGIREAGHLTSAPDVADELGDESSRVPKRRLGFREPGDEEGET